MLKNILRFFQEEKTYTVLFCLLLALGIFAWLGPKPGLKPQGEPETKALEVFKNAEEQFHKKIDEAGSLEAYFEDRPFLRFLLQFLSIALTVAVVGGLALNFLWVFNARWRNQWLAMRGSPGFEWKFSMLFKVLLLFLAINVVLGVALGLAWKIFFRGASENSVILLQTTLADIVAVSLILWMTRREGGQWGDVGLRMPQQGALRETFVGWGAYLALIPPFLTALLVLIALSRLLAYEPPPHPLVHVFLEEAARSPFLVGYSVFLATVVGPVIEEIFFRGFCYPIFKKQFGMAAALVLSALLFALIHESTFAFLPIFILGLGLAYVYELRGSLLAPIVMHVTHNSILLAYFFLAKEILLQEVSGQLAWSSLFGSSSF